MGPAHFDYGPTIPLKPKNLCISYIRFSRPLLSCDYLYGSELFPRPRIDSYYESSCAAHLDEFVLVSPDGHRAAVRGSLHDNVIHDNVAMPAHWVYFKFPARNPNSKLIQVEDKIRKFTESIGPFREETNLQSASQPYSYRVK